MTQATVTDPFAEFASLRRGDAAPPWLLAAITAGWGWDPARASVSLIAVSENATFRLDIDGAPRAVLRVHRPGYVDPNQIASELSWVRALSDEADVAVPEVLRLGDGSPVLRAERPGEDEGADPWFIVAFAYLEGEVLEDVADIRPHYRRIGEITAAFHAHAEQWRRPAGFDRFTWNIEDMVGASSRWGDWRGAALTAEQFTLLERAEAQALERLAPLVSSGEGRGLIHADLRPSNIMTAGGELTVIDFDDCGFGWYLYDFASALSFIEHEEGIAGVAADWIAGYTAVRPLSAQQLEQACAFSMIRRLQLLGWTTTHREDALPPELWRQMIPGTASVAAKYLASPTWLVDEMSH